MRSLGRSERSAAHWTGFGADSRYEGCCIDMAVDFQSGGTDFV